MVILSLLFTSVLSITNIPIGELQKDTSDNNDILRYAITTDGLFTLSHLPYELTKAYDILANELPECGNSNGSGGIDGRTVELGDGTIRTTYAQKSMNATPHFLQRNGCGNSVTESVNYIRSQLEGIGNTVAKAIDKVITFNTPPAATTASGIIDDGYRDVNSVVDIINIGQDNHLDHIHVYSKTDNNINDNIDWKDYTINNEEEEIHYNTTLTLHIDQGVFLLLILPPGDSNFYYEDGITNRQVPLNVPSLDDNNSDGSMRVVVLMGNTLKSFIGTTPSIRPLPHAVQMNISSNPRLVFGRMFLLPPNFKSPLPSLNSITFEQWTQSAMIPNDDDDTDEIAFSKRRLAGECKAGEIYCWMQCMANTCNNDNEMPVCWDKATNELCPVNDGLHHKTCGVECAIKPSSGSGGNHNIVPTPDPNAFCTGSTAMFMNGFNWMGNPTTQCVILFIPTWILDTPWKFAIGCIGVLLLGMLVEGILWARRRYLYYITNKWIHAIIGALAFGISVSIAYLAMLVVMTYSCELFLCLCSGLVIGHFIFGNVRQSIGESAEPCCGDTTTVVDHNNNNNVIRRCSSDCAGQRLVANVGIVGDTCCNKGDSSSSSSGDDGITRV